MKRSRRVNIARQGLEELGDSFVMPPYEGTASLKWIMRVNFAVFLLSMALGCVASPGRGALMHVPLFLIGVAWLVQLLWVIIFIETPWIRRLLVTSSGPVLLGAGATICMYAGMTIGQCILALTWSPWFESRFGMLDWEVVLTAVALGPLGALAVFAITFFRVRAYRRDAQGRCTSCGYPIRTDASELCSECGKHPAFTEGRVA